MRAARPGEAAELTGLVLRSKAHWGYDAAFMERVRDGLTLGDEHLPHTVVAELGGRAAGVATLAGEPPDAVLDFLFVDPWAIGGGVGRALLLDALDRARLGGFSRLLVDSDPQAEEFYLRMGAVRIGERVSPSSGRALPLLAYSL